MSRAPIRPSTPPQVAPTAAPAAPAAPAPQSTGLTVAETRNIAKNELAESLPAFLQGDDMSQSTGLELVKGYIRPPRLKIVQPQSGPELKDEFFEGTVVSMPSKQLVAAVAMNDKNRPNNFSEVFYFVPIFSWPEFISVNPIELKGNAPYLRDRSLSPKSALAGKCRTPALRTENYIENGQPVIRDGKPLLIRNIECINFLVKVLYNVDETLWEESRIMTFNKGEFGKGCKFVDDIRFRRRPMYACVFQAQTGRRENEKGNWYGFDITDPSQTLTGVSPWVTNQDEFNHYETLFKEAQKFHAENAIEVVYDDDNDFDSNTLNSTAAASTVDAAGAPRY